MTFRAETQWPKLEEKNNEYVLTDRGFRQNLDFV
jgi:hypothetical protein